MKYVSHSSVEVEPAHLDTMMVGTKWVADSILNIRLAHVHDLQRAVAKIGLTTKRTLIFSSFFYTQLVGTERTLGEVCTFTNALL